MIIVLDDKGYSYKTVRKIQFNNEADLIVSIDASGQPYAQLQTNIGEIECAAGTMAIAADGSKTKYLTSFGWVER